MVINSVLKNFTYVELYQRENLSQVKLEPLWRGAGGAGVGVGTSCTSVCVVVGRVDRPAFVCGPTKLGGGQNMVEPSPFPRDRP